MAENIHDIVDYHEAEVDDGISIQEKISNKADEVLTTLSGKGNSAIKKVLNNVVAFMSSGAGAGASTLVSTLATEFQKKGLSVVVIDLNIMYPSQHIYFDIRQEITKKDLVSYLQGKNTIGDSIEYHNKVNTITSNNRNLTDYLNCDNDSAASAISEALDRLAYLFDIVIVDCPKDLSFDVVSAALYKADTIYLVMDDGVQSLINIPKIKNNFEITGLHTQKIKYIMNKRTSIYYPAANLKAMEVELESIIPFEIGVLASGLRGEIFTVKGEASSKTSKLYVDAIKQLAARVLEIGGYRENG